MKTEQGDILNVGEIQFPVVVVSNNFFNESGMAMVCPIVKNALEGPLHIKLTEDKVEGYILCEQLRYIDLKARRFSKTASLTHYDVLNISDAVMGIFDYQML